MTRTAWIELGPSLLVGAGIVASTSIAVRAAQSGWWVMAGPLLLALAVVGADILGSRMRGKSSAPSWAALILGGSFLLAGVILIQRDPGLVRTFLPLTGAVAWVTLLLRPETRRRACKGA